MSVDIDHHPRYHLSRNPDGSFVELEETDFSRGYLAFDREGERFVALYFVRSDCTVNRKKLISLGERVFLANRIQHPGVFAVTDFGDFDGTFYYATELIDGEPLEPYLERVQALPIAVAMDLGLQLCRLLRTLSDNPRVVACIGTSDLFVSFSAGQSLRLRLGGLGLSRVETPMTETQIARLWVPAAAHLLWKLVSAGLKGPEGKLMPPDQLDAFLEPFRVFIETVAAGRIRHTANDLCYLEGEFAKYAYRFLNTFGEFLRPLGPVSSSELRPSSFLSYFLVNDCFGEEGEAEFSEVSNFAVIEDSGQLQVLPPDRLKGKGGFDSLQRKMSHPYLMEHPNFVRCRALRLEENFICVEEEKLHGFNLAHLVERRGSLLTNEVIEILRQMHWILRQVEGLGVDPGELDPADVYFQFGDEVDDRSMANLLAGRRLGQWPDFEIKLHIGETVVDYLRPFHAVWPKVLDRLDQTCAGVDFQQPPANRTFVALTVYMLEYRTYWRQLFADDPDHREPLSQCAAFQEVAMGALAVQGAKAEDGRNWFLRSLRERFDDFSFRTEALEGPMRLPSIEPPAEPVPGAFVADYRPDVEDEDPEGEVSAEGDGQQRPITLAAAAAAAATAIAEEKKANPRRALQSVASFFS